MKVFISWSGERSRKLAEFLAGWLKKLPLAIEPWVSKDAIDPGTRWGKELAEALEGTSFGILCITSENQREPWINFEAGALSKTIDKSYVVPYLIGMTPFELRQPLKQFQAIEANKEDTWKLIETIHMASGDKSRTINDLEEAFDMWWSKLSLEIIQSETVPENVISQEPSMSDLKSSLDKVSTVLESLSARIIRWESDHFSGLTEGLGQSVGIVSGSVIKGIRRFRDEYSKENISLADAAREKLLEGLLSDLASDPVKFENMFSRVISRITERKLKQENLMHNDEFNK